MQSTEIHGDIIRVNGVYLPPVPGYRRQGYNLKQIDGRVYVNGWEWTGKEWKKTFRSIIYGLI